MRGGIEDQNLSLTSKRSCILENGHSRNFGPPVLARFLAEPRGEEFRDTDMSSKHKDCAEKTTTAKILKTEVARKHQIWEVFVAVLFWQKPFGRENTHPQFQLKQKGCAMKIETTNLAEIEVEPRHPENTQKRQRHDLKSWAFWRAPLRQKTRGTDHAFKS